MLSLLENARVQIWIAKLGHFLRNCVVYEDALRIKVQRICIEFCVCGNNFLRLVVDVQFVFCALWGCIFNVLELELEQLILQ